MRTFCPKLSGERHPIPSAVLLCDCVALHNPACKHAGRGFGCCPWLRSGEADPWLTMCRVAHLVPCCAPRRNVAPPAAVLPVRTVHHTLPCAAGVLGVFSLFRQEVSRLHVEYVCAGVHASCFQAEASHTAWQYQYIATYSRQDKLHTITHLQHCWPRYEANMRFHASRRPGLEGEEDEEDAADEPKDEFGSIDISHIPLEGREYRVASTGARVTLASAKPLLYMFCAKLPADRCGALLNSIHALLASACADTTVEAGITLASACSVQSCLLTGMELCSTSFVHCWLHQCKHRSLSVS